MRIMTVDFASKFSAACIMDESGEVYRQFDSMDTTSLDFVNRIVVRAIIVDCDYIFIEDVPYGISSQAMTKAVTRLQGALIHNAATHGILDKVFFVNPSTWQKTYPGVSRGDGRVEAARQAALELGYEPPNLIQDFIDAQPEGTRILKKNTNPLAKAMTDYIDAFLMARWVLNVGLPKATTVTGVQPPLI